MARAILHIDMDAFYASVEQRDRPELQGLPVIVGAPPERRGVVCAASYEARKFGVRSAIPSRTAARLCPQGVFLTPRMDRYREESWEIFKLVRGTGVVVEQVSVDEAYLDATHVVEGVPNDVGHSDDSKPPPEFPEDPQDAMLKAAVPLARHLKAVIRKERHLTASIGVASNKLLAKLGSDFSKPDGLTVVLNRDRVAFLRPLKCRALHGVGAVTEEILSKAGIRTVADIQDYRGDLRSLLGTFGPVLKRYAFGEDDREINTLDEVKSISSENTFERDTSDRTILRGCLRDQSAEVAARLEKGRLGARTIQVKVRYGDFTTVTRQFSVEDPITAARDIYRLACWLLGRNQLVNRPLRLIGLGVSSLSPLEGTQLVLPFQS